MSIDEGVNYEVRLKGLFNKLRFGSSFGGPHLTGGMNLPKVGATMRYPASYGNDGRFDVVQIRERRGRNPMVYVEPMRL